MLSKRWMIWTILALVYFVNYFHRVAPGVVATDLVATFRIPAAVLGTLSSIDLWIFALMAIPAGVLADTFGPRRTVTLATLTMALGSLMFGLAASLNTAFLGRFLIGLGGSVIFISILRVCSAWFASHELGTMSGLTLTAGNLGALFAGAPLAIIVGAIGWRFSFELLGAMTMILALAGWWLVTDRPRAEPWPPAAAMWKDVLAGIRQVATNRHTWPPAIATAGIYSTLLAFSGLWGVPYLMQVYNMDRLEAAKYTMTVGLGVTLGSPLVGFLSDKVLRRRRLPYTIFAFSNVLLWLILVSFTHLPDPALYSVCFTLGLLSASFILVWPCVKEVNRSERAGIALGVPNTLIWLVTALLQPILGIVLDLYWDGLVRDGMRIYSMVAYRVAFSVCLFIAFVAAISTFFVKETRCKNMSDSLIISSTRLR